MTYSAKDFETHTAHWIWLAILAVPLTVNFITELGGMRISMNWTHAFPFAVAFVLVRFEAKQVGSMLIITTLAYLYTTPRVGGLQLFGVSDSIFIATLALVLLFRNGVGYDDVRRSFQRFLHALDTPIGLAALIAFLVIDASAYLEGSFGRLKFSLSPYFCVYLFFFLAAYFSEEVPRRVAIFGMIAALGSTILQLPFFLDAVRTDLETTTDAGLTFGTDLRLLIYDPYIYISAAAAYFLGRFLASLRRSAQDETTAGAEGQGSLLAFAALLLFSSTISASVSFAYSDQIGIGLQLAGSGDHLTFGCIALALVLRSWATPAAAALIIVSGVAISALASQLPDGGSSLVPIAMLGETSVWLNLSPWVSPTLPIQIGALIEMIVFVAIGVEMRAMLGRPPPPSDEAETSP